MIPGGLLTIGEVLECTGGDLLAGELGVMISGISTDSRTLRPGELFVALKGDRFDGHDFFPQAIARGANGVLGRHGSLSVPPRGWMGTTALIQVEDPLYALGEIARHWRARHKARLLAITGSNGKTTTKDMAAAILSRNSSVVKTEGNLNNLIGLPLTLMGLRGHHEIAVVEMGMNEPGEIRRLCEIARPDFGLITQVAPAHLEGLKSIEAVAEAKGELFQALREGDTAIVNADDPQVKRLARSCRGRQLTYGEASGTDVRGLLLDPFREEGARMFLEVSGEKRLVRMQCYGRPCLSNALAAAAASWAMGAPLEEIVQGLETFRSPPMRLALMSLGEDIHIIDDTYNANPASMAQALETLSRMASGRKVAVLGDMLELGAYAPEAHRAAGRRAADLGIDVMIAAGVWAREVVAGAQGSPSPPKKTMAVSSSQEALDELMGELRKGDWILVKGSRGVAMERVVEGLIAKVGLRASDETDRQETGEGI